jgi:hypothetical protein
MKRAKFFNLNSTPTVFLNDRELSFFEAEELEDIDKKDLSK